MTASAPPATNRRRGWKALLHAARGLRKRSLFLFTRWLVRRLGFDGMRKLGALVGTVHFHADHRVRRRCLAGLAAWLDRDADDPALAATLREAYRVNTVAMLEVLSMLDRKLDTVLLDRHSRVEGMAHLEAARTGRGVIVLAMHSGNNLFLAARLAAAGLPISTVYHRTLMMSKEFFAAGLPRYDLDGILANDGLVAYTRMREALRNNRVVMVAMDQGVSKAETGLSLRFLGKDMPTPKGVALLARRCRAPIVPITIVAADPQWRYEIGPRLDLAPDGSLEDDIRSILHHMEGEIRARPQLWSWPHRRWCKYPVAPAPVGNAI